MGSPFKCRLQEHVKYRIKITVKRNRRKWSWKIISQKCPITGCFLYKILYIHNMTYLVFPQILIWHVFAMISCITSTSETFVFLTCVYSSLAPGMPFRQQRLMQTLPVALSWGPLFSSLRMIKSPRLLKNGKINELQICNKLQETPTYPNNLMTLLTRKGFSG